MDDTLKFTKHQILHFSSIPNLNPLSLDKASLNPHLFKSRGLQLTKYTDPVIFSAAPGHHLWTSSRVFCADLDK